MIRFQIWLVGKIYALVCTAERPHNKPTPSEHCVQLITRNKIMRSTAIFERTAWLQFCVVTLMEGRKKHM
jgi:hypothetical protein